MFTRSLPELGMILLLLLVIMVLCVKTGKLTVGASVCSVLIGCLVFAGSGYAGLSLLGTFFILGVLATAHKKEQKATIHRDGDHPEKRTAGQVFANGGVAGLAAIAALADPIRVDLYSMMLGASLAAATADTVSSELGIVYGRNFINVLTFAREEKGLDGVISREGTLLGVAGSLVIAGVYALFEGFDLSVLWIVIAGNLGNLADSILGASLERGRYIGNNAVNFLSTLLAALVVAAISV